MYKFLVLNIKNFFLISLKYFSTIGLLLKNTPTAVGIDQSFNFYLKVNPLLRQSLGIKGLCEVNEPTTPAKKKQKKNSSVHEHPVNSSDHVKEVEPEEMIEVEPNLETNSLVELYDDEGRGKYSVDPLPIFFLICIPYVLGNVMVYRGYC